MAAQHDQEYHVGISLANNSTKVSSHKLISEPVYLFLAMSNIKEERGGNSLLQCMKSFLSTHLETIRTHHR